MEFLHGFIFIFKGSLFSPPLNLERMPANSDQTRPASLPFFACYELMLFGCLCIGMSFFFWGPEVKGMHQSLAPQPTMNNQLICDFHLLSYLGI